MTRANGIRADVARWESRVLRLTTFHQGGTVNVVEGLWQRITGQPYASSSRKPNGDRIEVGRIGSLRLILQAQTQSPVDGRIDWVLSDDLSSENAEPAIVALPLRLDAFEILMDRWLLSNEVPDTIRIAFGAVSMLRVANEAEGYVTISNYLNFDVDPGSTSDFTFTLNHKRRSVVSPEWEINRVMKWSVGNEVLLTIAVPAGQTAQTSQTPMAHCCFLELDINTVPRAGQIIPRDRFIPLLSEMVQLGLEIVREGDIL